MLRFFEQRINRWRAAASQLGIAVSDVDTLDDAVTDALELVKKVDALRNELAAAKEARDEALADVRGFGGDMVKSIRTYAELMQEPENYTTAQLPAPRTRRTLPDPQVPQRVKAALRNDGAVDVTWRAPSGGYEGKVFFTVHRSIIFVGPDGAFLPPTAPREIGTAGGDRMFTDRTLPPGVGRVQYMVMAHRGKRRSDLSEPAVLRFGGVVGVDPACGSTQAA